MAEPVLENLTVDSTHLYGVVDESLQCVPMEQFTNIVKRMNEIIREKDAVINDLRAKIEALTPYKSRPVSGIKEGVVLSYEDLICIIEDAQKNGSVLIPESTLGSTEEERMAMIKRIISDEKYKHTESDLKYLNYACAKLHLLFDAKIEIRPTPIQPLIDLHRPVSDEEYKKRIGEFLEKLPKTAHMSDFGRERKGAIDQMRIILKKRGVDGIDVMFMTEYRVIEAMKTHLNIDIVDA